MKVQCLGIAFRPGIFGPSVKKTVGNSNNQNHNCDQPSPEDNKPRLVVQVRTERGSVADINIDTFFKKNLGKLTEWRRTLIAQAMPTEIQVTVCRADYGQRYLEIVESELESWLSNCYDPWVVTKAERRMKNGKGKGGKNSATPGQKRAGKKPPLFQNKKLVLRQKSRETDFQISAD